MAQMDEKYRENLLKWNHEGEKSGFDFDGEIWVYTMLELMPTELLSSNARLALLVLNRHCNPTHQCFVGQHTLAQFMGATDRTVRNAVKELEKRELIVRTKRPGTSDVYFLRVWADELNAPPLTETGQMDKTAPTAPDHWLVEGHEMTKNYERPFYNFIRSGSGKKWKVGLREHYHSVTKPKLKVVK